MRVLYVSCSPRGHASESHRLALKVIDHVTAGVPTAQVVHRPLGGGALAHVDEDYSVALGGAPSRLAQGATRGTLAMSDALIQELEAADVVVIGTPMHNYTVPSALKAWIDHVVRVHRTFGVTREGKVGKLRDRPVFVAVASGGVYSGDHARQPDFLTPYLTAILATIGLRDITFFSVEATAVGGDTLLQARARADQALQAHFAPVRRRQA